MKFSTFTQKRNYTVYAILADTFGLFLYVMIVTTIALIILWSKSKAIASRVPGMKTEIVALEKIARQGEKQGNEYKGTIAKQNKVLRNLRVQTKRNRIDLANANKRGGTKQSIINGLEKTILGLNGQIEQGRISLAHAEKSAWRGQTTMEKQRGEIVSLTGSVRQLVEENGKLINENGVYKSRLRSGDPVTVVCLIDVTR